MCIPEFVARMCVMQHDGSLPTVLSGDAAQRAIRLYLEYNREDAKRIQGSCPEDMQFMQSLINDMCDAVEAKCLGNPDLEITYVDNRTKTS